MELLSGIVLALHLICVNLAASAPFIAIWLDWREGKQDEAANVAGNAGRWLLWLAVVTLLLGALLGLVMGAMIWSESYSEVIKVLGRRIFYGVFEYVFSLVLFGAALFWWRRTSPEAKKARIGRTLVVLLGATNLIYHFPPLFVLMSNLATSGPVEEFHFVREMMTPSVLSRSLHFALASFAVSGAALIAWDRWGAGTEIDKERLAAKWGGWIALVPTGLQFIVGTWVLLAMPKESQKELMGSDILATIAFLASLIFAFGMLHMLAKTALRRTDSAMSMSVIMLAVTIVLMTVAMRLSRPTPPTEAKPEAEASAGR